MKSLTLGLLRLYKRWISPVFPPSCRYVPTCSEYAMEAVERHGVVRGGLMAGWRLLRCHPLAAGGLDAVASPTYSQKARMSGERRLASLGGTDECVRPYTTQVTDNRRASLGLD
ncbi:MAG: membrane protein insertion efficiency factor YidD, partial [Terriglobales bacterium]